MYFYTDELNISDSLKLDIHYLRLKNVNGFDGLKNRNTFDLFPADAINYPHISNISENNENITNNILDVNNIELCVADESKTNRIGIGTTISMDIVDELFTTKIIQDSKSVIEKLVSNDNNNGIRTPGKNEATTNIYLADLYSLNRDIYTKKEKTLIRCSDIIYTTSNTIINNYFNGYNTYNSAIIYNSEGEVLWETLNLIL